MTHEQIGKLHNFLKTGIIESEKTQDFLKQSYLKYVDNKNESYYNNLIPLLDNGKEFKTEYDWNISLIPISVDILRYNESIYCGNCTIAIWRKDYMCYVYSNESGYIWDFHLFTPKRYRGNKNTAKYFSDLNKILSTLTLLNDNSEMECSTTVPYIDDIFNEYNFVPWMTEEGKIKYITSIKNKFEDVYIEKENKFISNIYEYVDEVDDVNDTYISNVFILNKIWNWGL